MTNIFFILIIYIRYITIMKIRSLDFNGDWLYGQGFSNLSQNSVGIQLNIITKLKEWQRDCFIGLNNGIDWSTRVGSTQQSLLQSDIQNLVQSLFGVQNINNYSANYNAVTRNLVINFTYTDIYNNIVNLSFNPLT